MVLRIKRRLANYDSDTGWISIGDVQIGEDLELPARAGDKEVFLNILDVTDDGILIGLSDYYYVENTDMDMDVLKRAGKYMEDGGAAVRPIFITFPVYAGKEIVLKSASIGQVEYLRLYYGEE